MDGIKCRACGTVPGRVVQSRFISRPAQWLRPGDHCDFCTNMWRERIRPDAVRDAVNRALDLPV